MSTTATAASLPPDPRPKPVRVVGPRLKILLLIVFGMVALLGANAVYLTSITALEWYTGQTYQDFFYQYMFLFHLVLGLLLIVPFVVFGLIHMWLARKRRNRRAVKIGYALFSLSVLLLVSGILLMRVGGFDLRQPTTRSVIYWLHVISPLACIWLYWLHRLAGPRIKWRVGLAYVAAVGLIVVGMVFLHTQDPRRWYAAGPKEGAQYFEPSLARTSSGNFIPAETLMMDDYCLKCHQDAYRGWFHSAHHFSSFSNPAYLASVRETREVALKRDGNVKASRWCAGCHDPVPFFSGAFDDPKFDVVKHPTAQAGITCTTCHAITNVNSTRGNADYTIEEPMHYPFAYSKNAVLQFINNQLVKAKPSFHKKTFLKPFHNSRDKSAEFCSTCHKVHLPFALNHYKEFLRGQNHYDPYLLSGVSGHGARSFYYPEKAKTKCSDCHMPLMASQDFGAKDFDSSNKLSIHDHLFPAANTGLAWLKHDNRLPDYRDVIEAHQQFLKEVMRVDVFGIKEGGTIDGKLHAPLRPDIPALRPGSTYLLEAVVRTLKMGHLFTQGTTDSNEVWLEVTVTSGDRVLGRSGAVNEQSTVDPWSYFVNVFMLDRDGNRINRRNPQDIFVPLYNHQIPPGAAAVVHYSMGIPEDVIAPITVEIKLQYRKFDQEYMEFVAKSAQPGDLPLRGHQPGQAYRNELPITTLAVDRITFPIAGIEGRVENATPKIEPWQRWNDYGIGLFLEGKAELRQAADAFAEVEKLGRFDGPLNLARVLEREGRLDEAVDAIQRAAKHNKPAAPPWVLAWLSGVVNRQQGHFDEAEKNFRSVLETKVPNRDFDFGLDYEVINLLGQTLYDRAKQARGSSPEVQARRQRLLDQASEQFQKTLALDSENVTAHYSLSLIYKELDQTAKAAEHQKLHDQYRGDDQARGIAVGKAREKYPAANHAAEALVIYPLNGFGTPGMPKTASTAE